MKKITTIASLLILFAACQKADIHPRVGCTDDTSEAKRLGPATQTPVPTGSGDVNSLGGGNSSSPTVDPNNPSGDQGGGDITDPLRKKDQKDNK